jgi:HEAT repeat protein
MSIAVRFDDGDRPMASTTPSPAGPEPRPRREPPARRILLVAQNLRELSSRDVAVASSAATRLDEMAPTTGELTVLMTDHNPFIRSGAAWWLRNQASELPSDTVSALRASIYDPNPHVIQAALGTVGVLRLQAARDDVLACLDDPNPAVVHGAIFAVGRLGPTELGGQLLRFLNSKEAHLEVAAVQALTNLRYLPAVPLLTARLEACCGAVRRTRSHFELPRRLLNSLVALEAHDAVPLLIRIAQEEIGLRGMAVQALIDLRAEQAGPALLPLLVRLHSSVHEEKLCGSLLYLMTAIDYRFAGAEVRSFLEHRLAGVRCAALKAVARWQDAEAAPAVRKMAHEDASAFVRPVAVVAMTDLLGEQALPDLGELTSDANALVRAAVAEALGKRVPLPAEGQAILARLSVDDAAPVARAAQEALSRQPSTPAPPPPAVSPSVLPPGLLEQAPAARAFLARWRAELPAQDTPERTRIEQALATLLGVLSCSPLGAGK